MLNTDKYIQSANVHWPVENIDFSTLAVCIYHDIWLNGLIIHVQCQNTNKLRRHMSYMDSLDFSFKKNLPVPKLPLLRRETQYCFQTNINQMPSPNLMYKKSTSLMKVWEYFQPRNNPQVEILQHSLNKKKSKQHLVIAAPTMSNWLLLPVGWSLLVEHFWGRRSCKCHGMYPYLSSWYVLNLLVI